MYDVRVEIDIAHKHHDQVWKRKEDCQVRSSQSAVITSPCGGRDEMGESSRSCITYGVLEQQL